MLMTTQNAPKLSVAVRTVPSQEFSAALTSQNWDGCRIEGDFSLGGIKVEGALVIHNATFTGIVDFGEARFERSLDLTGCRFEQKLLLADARVAGPLRLDRTIMGKPPAKELRLDRLYMIVDALTQGWKRVFVRRPVTPEERIRARQSRRQARTRARVRRILRDIDHSSPAPVVADFDRMCVEGCVSLIDAVVAGSVTASYSRIASDLRLDGARIAGDLRLRQSSIGEIVTDASARLFAGQGPHIARPHCHIGGEFILTCAKVTGDVRLFGAEIHELTMQATQVDGNLVCRPAPLRPRVFAGAWLSHVRVRGTVDLSGMHIRGTLLLANAEIGGRLMLSRPEDHRRSLVVKGQLNMDFIRVHADATLNLARVGGDIGLNGAKIDSDLWCEGTKIGGALWLQNAVISGAALLRSARSNNQFRCTIGGHVWIFSTSIGRDLDISGSHFASDFLLQNTAIGDNLVARVMGGCATQIDGNAMLGSPRIHGNVWFGGTTFGRDLTCDGISIAGPLSITPDLDMTADARVVFPRIAGRLQAEFAEIGRAAKFLGLEVGASRGDGTCDPGAGINLTGAQIGGDLVLHSLSAAAETLGEIRMTPGAPVITAEREQQILDEYGRAVTVLHGDLRLTRATVRSGVDISGASVCGVLDLRDATVRSNITCKATPRRATAGRVDLETLEMTGDVDLTGLTLAGDLILRDARIRGRVELYPHDRPGDGADRCIVGGALLVNSAEITHLVFSGETLAPRPGQPGEPRVVLEGAKVGLLQIAHPVHQAIDLTNAAIDRLDNLDDLDVNTLVTHSEPYRKSNYLAVESLLRNSGLQERADRVHVLMRQRDRSFKKSFVKRAVDRLLDISIGYGTATRRLGLFMILLFTLSILLFSDRSRIEYDLPPDKKPQQPASWHEGDATLFAAQLHVPIISLGVKSDVQPRGFGWKVYAMSIVAAHWLMWPLLIASVSGLVRKNT